MQKKIVPVRIIMGCIDCPGLQGGFCVYVDPERDTTDDMKGRFERKEIFPVWCPLEDYVEEDE